MKANNVSISGTYSEMLLGEGNFFWEGDKNQNLKKIIFYINLKILKKIILNTILNYKLGGSLAQRVASLLTHEARGQSSNPDIIILHLHFG